MEPHLTLTIIVRLTLSDGGKLGGVGKRVRSREKQAFHGVVALVEVVAEPERAYAVDRHA